MLSQPVLEATERMADRPPPVDCGRRLLAHVIDERAQNGHKRAFASIPISNDPTAGLRDVSYALFANAINRLATFIRDDLGPPTSEGESFVYLGPSDLRYHILIIAASKAGYVPFLISPRNSVGAFAALLGQANANKLLSSLPASPAVAAVQQCRPMKVSYIPALQDLLDDRPAPHVALEGSWEALRCRPFLQIHSSGTTGTPKLITLPHGSFTALDAFQLMRSNGLANTLRDSRWCTPLPGFHIAGIIWGLAAPIFVDATVVLAPPAPLTADLVDALHVSGHVDCTFLVPSFVIDLVKESSFFHHLTSMRRVFFGGGPLPEEVGRQVAQHTSLISIYGSSELLAAPELPKDEEDWAYFKFNAEEGGLEFRERADGLFEMIVCRKAELDLCQPVFVAFPHLDEFATKDLFAPHPSKPGLWKYTSRADDVLVFSNGEKLNPVSFEGLVSTSPAIKGCLVVGHGRFQPALLLEPSDPSQAREEVIEQTWPCIQRANEAVVRHGRIARDCVIFVTPGKPLPRAGKGTIQRAAANALYARELNEFYSRLQIPLQVGPKPKQSIDTTSLDATVASLTAFITSELGLERLDSCGDFFACGMDSLQVLNIVRAINSTRSEAMIDAKLVYDNPSIYMLARAIHADLPRRFFAPYDSDDEELKESWRAMDSTFRELTAHMGHPQRRRLFDGWLWPSDETPVVQPDGGTVAWTHVLCMALVNFSGWGLVSSWGVFQSFYEAQLLSQYSPSTISWIGTLQGSLLLVVGVVSGPLFDKGYFKPLLVMASVGLVFALMMLSLSTRYYQIMLSQGVLSGTCVGLLYVPSIALIPVYFKRRRGLAMGLALCGGSLGGVVYPIVFRRLLSELGFGWAVRIMGFVALVALGIAVVLTRPIGTRITRQLVDRSALHETPYVILLLSNFLLLAALFVPSFLAAAYSQQKLHASASTSPYLISIVNAAQMFGRLLPTWSSDFNHQIMGPEACHFFAEVAIAVLAFSWIAIHNLGGFIPWLVIYGFFNGMTITLPAVFLPHICPNLAVYGTRLGMLYAVGGLGLLISTPVATALNARTGGYLGSQIWTGGCCVAAFVVFIYTGLQVRRRRLLYESGKKGRSRRRGRKTQKASLPPTAAQREQASEKS